MEDEDELESLRVVLESLRVVAMERLGRLAVYANHSSGPSEKWIDESTYYIREYLRAVERLVGDLRIRGVRRGLGDGSDSFLVFVRSAASKIEDYICAQSARIGELERKLEEKK